MSGKVRLLCVGKLTEPYLRDGCAEFVKRLSRYVQLSIEEVRDVRDDIPQERALRTEGEALLARLPAGEPLLALAIDGKGYDSVAFSEMMGRLLDGGKTVNLVIGGSRGLSAEVLAQAQEKVSFSAMTFPHGLMRLILLEQLYRACRIRSGESYHK